MIFFLVSAPSLKPEGHGIHPWIFEKTLKCPANLTSWARNDFPALSEGTKMEETAFCCCTDKIINYSLIACFKNSIMFSSFIFCSNHVRCHACTVSCFVYSLLLWLLYIYLLYGWPRCRHALIHSKMFSNYFLMCKWSDSVDKREGKNITKPRLWITRQKQKYKGQISGNDEVLALKSPIKPSISRAECEHRTS